MAQLTQAEFDAKYEQLFADNAFRNITEGTFRTLKDDIKDSFVNLKSLTVKQVRGAVYPVPYTDNLGLIPPAYRILGMEAVARNGTDSATGGAGVIEPPITYQLIRDSAGTIDALLDEQPDTTGTVKARWVRTSGTAQEQMESFPPFEQEDRTPSYAPGDRFSYEFPGGIMRLAQVKVAQGYVAATPTGEDDDPNYAYFAPLLSGGGGASTFADLLGDPLDNGQLDALISTLAPKASPAFTGAPTAPTLSGSATGTSLATAATVRNIMGDVSAQASTSTRGTVGLATDAEVQAGVEATKAITSVRLANWWTWLKGLPQTFADLRATILRIGTGGPAITGAVDIDDVSTTKKAAVRTGVLASANGWVLNSAVPAAGDPLTDADYVGRRFTDTVNTPSVPLRFECHKDADAMGATRVIWTATKISKA